MWGYEDLREALADSADEQHEEMLEATELDPARFDADEVNRALGGGEDARRWSVHSSEDPRTTAVRRTA